MRSWYGGSNPAFSPDGHLLAVTAPYGPEGGFLGGIELLSLDVMDSDPVLLTYVEEMLDNPMFSPDGSTLVTKSGWSTICFWDSSGPEILDVPYQVITTDSGPYLSGFSPDGTLLAGRSYDGQNNTVHLWDVQTGEERAVFNLGSVMPQVSFNTDGSVLLGRGVDGSVHLWNTATGEEIASLPPGSQLSPDWTRAASWDGSSTVQVTDLDSAAETDIVVIEDYLGTTVALSSSAALAVFELDGLQILDLRTGQQRFSLQAAGSPSFNGNGTRLLTIAWIRDGNDTVQVWDVPGQDSASLLLDLTFECTGAVLNDDGTLLATAAMYREAESLRYALQLWNTQTGELLVEWETDLGGGDLAFSPDGTVLASGTASMLRLWNVSETLSRSEGTEIGSVDFGGGDPPHFYGIDSIEFSADSSALAAHIRFAGWDGANGTYLYAQDLDTITASEGPILDTLFWGNPEVHEALDGVLSPNGRIIVSRDIASLTGPEFETRPGGTRLWNLETDTILAELGNGQVAAFSQDGSMLATYDTGGIYLWDVGRLVTGEAEPLMVLTPQNLDVRELAFNPEGTILYVRDSSGVSVWGIAQ